MSETERGYENVGPFNPYETLFLERNFTSKEEFECHIKEQNKEMDKQTELLIKNTNTLNLFVSILKLFFVPVMVAVAIWGVTKLLGMVF